MNLPPEILATIIEIEKILDYKSQRTEYERIDGLLKVVFGTLMHHKTVNLKEYDHKIKHPDHPWSKSDWDCIPF